MPQAERLDTFLEDRFRGLEAAGVPEARIKLEWLASRRLRFPRLELPLHAADTLPGSLVETLDRDLARLRAGEPLQHVLGDAPFLGLSIQCDRRALIPRPETEWLVEQVLGCASIWLDPQPLLADIGCGTGCIALALAAAKPRARVAAVDSDPGALALAKENGRRLNLLSRVDFREGDLLAGLPQDAYDAVVSNPPYIPTPEWEALEPQVRDFEPRRALDGGADGLDVIRPLVRQAFDRLKPARPLWLEIGYNQGPSVAALLRESGYERVEIRRDWNGHDRVACGWRP